MSIQSLDVALNEAKARAVMHPMAQFAANIAALNIKTAAEARVLFTDPGLQEPLRAYVLLKLVPPSHGKIPLCTVEGSRFYLQASRSGQELFVYEDTSGGLHAPIDLGQVGYFGVKS